VVHAIDLPHRLHEAIARFGDCRMGLAPHRLVPRKVAARGPFFDATALVDRLLMDKLEAEIARVRRAARLADDGYAVFRAAARAGRPDYELIAEVEAFFRANGAEDNFQIIGVGGTEVRGMAPPSGKRLKEGDLVTTELTPCVDGYHAQICRTLVVGAPSAAQTAAFAVFREALEAGLAAVRPGATAADIARAENDVFRCHGLGEYVSSEYTRVRGHGLGLFPDSKPPILENVATRIDAGMTLIVHPNTYHPAVGYIVLGDSLLVSDGGCEVLTTTPRALFSTAP
jgi:Xaa-Pro aminopeptidase